ncbi:nucleotidyl transferase AbiEii/AbiGii toxin family protein [Pseudomonas sp. S2_H08]
MSSNADHNYELIEFVAEGLGEAFLAEVAFVGGCTTAMLVTDTAVLDDIRFTDDVDLVIELAGISAWNQLTERLAAKGFKITGEDEVNCRFRFNDVVVDVMPSDPAVLGYANRWFVEGLARADKFTLPSGTAIQIFQPAYFLATKLEAFAGRGNGDPYHKDVEDMIILIDGRPELLEEVGQTDKDLKGFITEGVQKLMALDGVGYVIESSGSVQANPGRGQIIHRRMKALANA